MSWPSQVAGDTARLAKLAALGQTPCRDCLRNRMVIAARHDDGRCHMHHRAAVHLWRLTVGLHSTHLPDT